ncbi:hypothetical protein ACN9MB_07430 [Dyella kyungheensis]|jgi:hypothetical protein|uniref:hypothetical protein n=1 Tax=Dyella kyungheensis TaxID=1242174 RepID=UPI003CF290B8
MTKRPEQIAVAPATLSEVNMDNPLNALMTRRSFTREEIAWIREVVIIGLQSFGELEKVFGAKGMIESAGGEWPGYLDVRHPTGDTEVVTRFADVLRILND